MQYFYRHEWKYLIPKSTTASVLDRLLSYGMRKDPKHDQGYVVTSLYLDSLRLDDYADKAAGLLDRKKIRVRIYQQNLTAATKEIWLEKKIKHDTLIRKERVLLTHSEYRELSNGSRITLLQKLKARGERHTERILGSIYAKSMKPHIIVRYHRTPLVSLSYGDFRITLDSHIETCLNSDLRYTPFMTPVHNGQTVIEVKSLRELPAWFGVIIRAYGLERITFSKYIESVEALYKYHPIPR